MSAKKFFWLVAGQVITRDTMMVERFRGLNSLMVTEHDRFTRNDIATAQHTIMKRFVTETPQIEGNKIIDVFIYAISKLGNMTLDEFHKEFQEGVHEVIPPTGLTPEDFN